MNESKGLVLTPILFLIAVLSALSAAQLTAQSGSGLSGVVRTVHGVPLDGANVVVLGTTLGDATDAKGHFRVNGLSQGSFEVEASLIGYKPAVQSVNVKVGQYSRISFYLRPDTLLLAQVTVTAPKSQEGLARMAPNLEVISRDEIAKSNAQTVTELLQRVSGVFVKRYGNSGQQQSIAIRGSEANQVLVLIDGQTATNPQSGQTGLNNVMLNNIERVEILKGGASALFGSNAVAGVINLVTKSGPESRKTEASFQQALAAFGTHQLGLQIGQRLSRVRYSLAVDWLESDGDFGFVNVSRVSRPTQKRSNADFGSYNAFARLKWDVSTRANLEMRAQLYDLSTGTPGEISNPTPLARSGNRRYLTNLSLTSSVGEKSLVSVSAHYDVFNNDFENPERAVFDGSNDNTSYGLQARHSLEFSPQHLVTYGAEYQHDEVSGNNIAGHPTRESFSLFARGKSSFGNKSGVLFKSLGVYPALRVDKFTRLDTEVSPKVSVSLNDFVTAGLKLVIGAGRSFRVPSFNSLFFISTVQVRNNPELKPERATEFDFGLHYDAHGSRAGQFRFSGVYFHRNVDGIILWLPDFRFIWSPRNIASVISRGVELSLSWTAASEVLKLESNYTFNDSRFDLPGNRQAVPYRPRHVLNSKLTLLMAGFNIRLDQSWVSERFPNVAGTNAIPAYWLLDFTVSREFGIGSLQLLPKFSLNNLFSKRYAVVSNFPMPGREFRISLTTNI